MDSRRTRKKEKRIAEKVAVGSVVESATGRPLSLLRSMLRGILLLSVAESFCVCGSSIG